MVTPALVAWAIGISETGAAAAVIATVADVLLNFGPPPSPMQPGRISHGVLARQSLAAATRPPGGIRAHDPELTARYVPEGANVRLWAGHDPHSETMFVGRARGSCLEPEFSENLMLYFDRALARSAETGDVVLVEELVDGQVYRAAKVFGRDEQGGPGLIYCNDGCYRLYSRANIKGRLVAAIGLAPGETWEQFAAEALKRPEVLAEVQRVAQGRPEIASAVERLRREPAQVA